MSVNIRQTAIGVSYKKQTDLVTPQTAGNMWKLTKVNSSLMGLNLKSENDAKDIGKGDEFAANNFLTNWDVGGQFEKYLSSQAFAFAACFGVGSITETAPESGCAKYVVVPKNAATTIDIDSFTVVEQLAAPTIDNAMVGCVVEGFTMSFSSGPGRANAKLNIDIVGTGNFVRPSTITLPATLTENFLNAGGATVVINGVTYTATSGVGAKALISAETTWKNNTRLDSGFFIGSGTANGGQIRGRMENGDREATLKFRVRLETNSTEYTKLIAQTEGTAQLKIEGALIIAQKHTAQVDFPRIVYSAVVAGEENGLSVLDVTCQPLRHSTNGFVTYTAITSVPAIGT